MEVSEAAHREYMGGAHFDGLFVEAGRADTLREKIEGAWSEEAAYNALPIGLGCKKKDTIVRKGFQQKQ